MDDHELDPKKIWESLLFCRRSANPYGDLCKVCPYDGKGLNCSNKLLSDASDLIRTKLCGGDSDGE